MSCEQQDKKTGSFGDRICLETKQIAVGSDAPRRSLYLETMSVLTSRRTFERLVDAQRTTVEVITVQGRKGAGRGGIVHLVVCVTTRPPGFAIGNHLDGVHGSV